MLKKTVSLLTALAITVTSLFCCAVSASAAGKTVNGKTYYSKFSDVTRSFNAQ